MAAADSLLLEWLREGGIVPEATLRHCLRRAAAGPIEEGRIEEAALAFLLEEGILDEVDLALRLAEHVGLETVDVEGIVPDPALLALVPAEMAHAHQLLPLAGEGEGIQVAVANPLDTGGTDLVAERIQRAVTPCVAARSALREAVARAYAGPEVAGPGEESRASLAGEPRTGGAPGGSSVEVEGLAAAAAAEEAPVVRYVQHLLEEAFRRRASDVHLEPLEHRFRVRYRVDGVLQEHDNPPKRLEAPILSRIKLVAGLSLAERRLPQDGRISARLGDRPVDLRVSSLPTAHGESLVLRILDKEGLQRGLAELGLLADDRARFGELLTRPDGVILVTGPTGSGKSTTLYSVLHSLNRPDRKIITVEDPVEYELSGINQVQVRPEVGMTFGAALRALLRQAPNIIMVGEIRDQETAEIVVQASLTGHLVFSTLHTNDAPSAISRLLDLGVPPFLVAASLRAVVAQRLVRRVCPHCAVPAVPEEWEWRALGTLPEEGAGADCRRGTGCAHCGGTGYHGRTGIFELLPLQEELTTRIDGECTLVELRQRARDLGLRTLREDGIRKVMAGRTTCSEVLQATLAAPGDGGRGPATLAPDSPVSPPLS